MKFYSFVRAVLTPFVRWFLRPRVTGKEKIPDKAGFIVCCNHQSMWDLFILVIDFPFQVRFMAKKEIFEKPIPRWFCSKLGAFPVERGSGDKSAIKNAMDVLDAGSVLGIYPEGTRNRDGRPGKAKAGAAMLALNSGADILPVAINYHGKPRLFGKKTLSYGEIIKNETLSGGAEKIGKTQIREATNIIMGEITKLWEKDN
ncbi:MAG: 1-acyl-sn-glycerol-3-phosphate acyltransferase [Clostridia bacterium]|nr:1-acyl-sn-glycerol-3-phosphate acyltransferase [Clostridia bacterium]